MHTWKKVWVVQEKESSMWQDSTESTSSLQTPNSCQSQSKASVMFSMNFAHGSNNFILEQPPVSVFSLRKSNAIDPTQLGQPLEQHNSWCQAVGEVMM
ncbi:hypothetical protein HGM15179_002706 [Zosterops borbonicus]|uniref:Uncharacterized protein n=1 Tax=Zosterops borbonicus TaxID=364589 RepID=A0A8K1LSB1_9PASS|nr:hypothetical protein HGM15179_002706 [Zosterops borbonicus]